MISTKNPSATDWSAASVDELTSFMEQKIELLTGCLPFPYIPVDESVYFSDFKKLFPNEKVEMFLGQILFKENSFIDSIENYEIKNTIKGMKKTHKITEHHCSDYRLYSRQFRRRAVVDIFGVEPAFFAALAKVTDTESVMVNTTTQIGEMDYRNLLLRDEDPVLVMYKKLHLYTFLHWMKKVSA